MIVSITGPAGTGKTTILRDFAKDKNVLFATPDDFETVLHFMEASTEFIIIDECVRLSPRIKNFITVGQRQIYDRIGGLKTVEMPHFIISSQLPIKEVFNHFNWDMWEEIALLDFDLGPIPSGIQFKSFQRKTNP